MRGSFIARLAVRTFLPLIALVAFVLGFYHLQAQAGLDGTTGGLEVRFNGQDGSSTAHGHPNG
jgi:hypothetical protein